MKLAFYAPLKPPDHPVPSGDRAMARGLIKALEHAGAKVTLASTLQSRDGAGDPKVQARIMAQAEASIEAIIQTGRAAGWQAWVTYHTYYKAPDLIGWRVAKALNIPYLQIEATRARKRLVGPWADFARAAEAASDHAQTIFYLTARDAVALEQAAPKGQHLIHLRPFLNRETLPSPSKGDGPMLAVGMMRSGDKLASYKIIAETLAHLPPDDWKLEIAGDGPARSEVESLMAPFGDAVIFLGEQDQSAMAQAYDRAALLFWPGVNEAFGMVYLEAQAKGMPVLAQDRPGVRDVLAPGDYPHVEDGAPALARRLASLLHDPAMRQQAGALARIHVGTYHLLPAASATLRGGLERVGVLV